MAIQGDGAMWTDDGGRGLPCLAKTDGGDGRSLSLRVRKTYYAFLTRKDALVYIPKINIGRHCEQSAAIQSWCDVTDCFPTDERMSVVKIRRNVV